MDVHLFYHCHVWNKRTFFKWPCALVSLEDMVMCKIVLVILLINRRIFSKRLFSPHFNLFFFFWNEAKGHNLVLNNHLTTWGWPWGSTSNLLLCVWDTRSMGGYMFGSRQTFWLAYSGGRRCSRHFYFIWET